MYFILFDVSSYSFILFLVSSFFFFFLTQFALQSCTATTVLSGSTSLARQHYQTIIGNSGLIIETLAKKQPARNILIVN